MIEHVTTEDVRALIEAASEFVELTIKRQAAEARVVTLARRMTRDWGLTDEEAIRAAGALATRLLLAKDEHGR